MKYTIAINANGKGTIDVDGVPIDEFIQGIDIEARVGEPTAITLYAAPGEIDFRTEVDWVTIVEDEHPDIEDVEPAQAGPADVWPPFWADPEDWKQGGF